MSNPGKHVIRRLKSPEADQLAEVEILSHDIETAFYQMHIWRDVYAPHNSMSREEKALSIALFRDAIVQFVGCFDPKSEFHVTKEAIFRTPEDLVFFNILKDMRDAFAAHKFGPYRQCVAGISATEKERSVRFVRQQFTGHLSRETTDKIIKFISDTGIHLALKMKELIPKILKGVEHLTDDQINAFDEARTFEVAPEHIRTSRRAFYRSKDGTGPTTKRSTRSTKRPDIS